MYRREWVAGVDEVGRGPLAGAVVAAAVILDPFVPLPALRDSKKLTAKQRDTLDLAIRKHAVAFAIGRAEVEEIDDINILWASMLAMKRAIDGLGVTPAHVLVDGNRVPPDLAVPADAFVKGDDRLDCIRAASIIAKVYRDREMVTLHESWPQYDFAGNKGYPTPAHLAALREHGPCPVHRLSFAPCKQPDLFEGIG